MTSILQVDWVFVDTIIIILLIILLIGVKIFKITHRWRNTFSNQAIIRKTLKKPPNISQNQYFFIRKWSLVKNLTQSNNRAIILIVSTNYKRKLLKFLIEGLTTYGFIVLDLKVRIKLKHDKIKYDIETKEWKLFLSSFLEPVLNENFNDSSYILLNPSRTPISQCIIISNSSSIGTILINPLIRRQNFQGSHKSIEDFLSGPQLSAIFSRRSRFYLKNKHFKKWKELISGKKSNYLVIMKARYSFKNYETILLGIIIDIIENELIESKI